VNSPPTEEPSQLPEEHDARHSPVPGKVREVDSDQLFQGEKSIVIRHGEETYRLLVTRHNRLILQK